MRSYFFGIYNSSGHRVRPQYMLVDIYKNIKKLYILKLFDIPSSLIIL